MSLALSDIFSARHTIAGIATRTPLVPSPHLTHLAGQDCLLKLETTQPTGAFKLRGAINAIARLPADSRGVICCSTGNHGRAVAFAARAKGLPAIVCMSSLVPQTKIDGVKAFGADIRIVGDNQDEAQAESRRLAGENGFSEISPFDDPHVIAGQGTIGLELMEDRPDIDMVLVPLSGGGLAAGVALAVKTIRPATKVIGVSMDRGAAMHASLIAGHPVEVDEVLSLADSLGGGIGLENENSFLLCRDLLEDVVLVGEDQIYRAMQVLYYEDRLVAEGASVVGVAALITGKLPRPRGPVATIITGRNADMGVFTQVVAGQDVTLGDWTITGQPYAP